MGDGVAAPVTAIVATLHGEKDKLLGIFDGEEAQQDLVEEGENSRVGADAESEREDGHGGEPRGAGEHAEGVLRVPEDGVKPAHDRQTASALVRARGPT